MSIVAKFVHCRPFRDLGPWGTTSRAVMLSAGHSNKDRVPFHRPEGSFRATGEVQLKTWLLVRRWNSLRDFRSCLPVA